MAAAGSVFSRAKLDYLHSQRLLGRIATVATATTRGLLGPAGGPAGGAALTSGYAAALRGAALLALAGAVVAILVLPGRGAPAEPPTQQPKERP